MGARHPMRMPAETWTHMAGWLQNDFVGVIRQMRLSFLPPLMVYFAAGVSGFSGIIESFFVKENLGRNPAFLAGLGFWAGLPWALKMPLGHMVDLFWQQKSLLVYLDAPLNSEATRFRGGAIADNKVIDPFKTLVSRNLEEMTRKVLAVLTPREEKVLRMRFGIGEKTDHTLNEISRKFDLTRERIRQIEARALRKLQHSKYGRSLKSFIDP